MTRYLTQLAGLIRHKVFGPLLLAAVFAAAAWGLLATGPESQRQAPRPAVIIADAIDIEAGAATVFINGQGVVGPAVREAELRPQVGGVVVATHPEFEPGGFIPAGEAILQIDPSDYDLAIADAKANVARARAAVELEKGQQVVAQEEFRLLEEDLGLDAASAALALRKPQLQRVEAEYASARAALDRANLNRERTVLTLPYDAVVVSVEAVENEFLATRDLAGVLVRADEFWVELRVRQDQLGRLTARTNDGPGSRVDVYLGGARYEGEVARLRADLSTETRMGGVFVSIKDPLSRLPANQNRPPLLMGAYVTARLDAGIIDNVISAPRRALRENSIALVADKDNILRQRTVSVVWELMDEILFAPTFEEGDRLILSRLSGAPPGASLTVRIVDPKTGEVLSAPDAIAERPQGERRSGAL